MTGTHRHRANGAARPSSGAQPALVLFDGDCPLCAREIAHYRGLRGAERLTWIDITRERDLEGRFGIGHHEAMARLHVRDTRGRWHTGAWAFAELWSHLPGYRQLARLVRRLRLVRLLDWGYGHFARWRLARRCPGGVCAARHDIEASTSNPR